MTTDGWQRRPMRSGTFENGEQVGEWTTYNRDGNVHKVTVKKLKAR